MILIMEFWNAFRGIKQSFATKLLASTPGQYNEVALELEIVVESEHGKRTWWPLAGLLLRYSEVKSTVYVL